MSAASIRSSANRSSNQPADHLVNLDNNGVKAIRLKGDTALSAGHIAANGLYDLIYDEAYNSANGAWVLLNPEMVGAYTAGGTDVAISDGGTGASTAEDALANLGIASFFPNYLSGLTLSNGTDATNDINIAAGAANDSTNARPMKLASGVTKRLDDVWTVGTGQGGLDTGTVADGTYHVWLIMRTDTGVVDALFSTSATSPTMPTNYTLKRRIGSIIRSSGSIVSFLQNGDVFTLAVPVESVAQNNPGTSARTATLNVPSGIVVEARISVHGDMASGSSSGLVTALAQTDTAPSRENSSFGVTSATNVMTQGLLLVHTNTSRQIRYRVNSSSPGLDVYIYTVGWADNRGRLG